MTVEIYCDDIWESFICDPNADSYLSEADDIPNNYVDTLLEDILGEEDWREQEYQEYRSSELDYLHYL